MAEPPPTDLDNATTVVRKPPERGNLAADPLQALTAYAPPAADLVALSVRADVPDSADAPDQPVPSQIPAQRAFSALPADAPEWMRAARVLADALEESIRRGKIDNLEQAAIERAWYSWTLGGATPRQVLRVAHLVRRAYDALRMSSRSGHEATLRDCAHVLHGNLPAAVKQAVPFERAVWVVRSLREAPDPWVAVVEGTAELLGWKDYARVHAAYVISAVIQKT
jgi:hypothetical protein